MYIRYTKKLLRNSLSLYRVKLIYTVTNAVQGEFQARSSI